MDFGWKQSFRLQHDEVVGLDIGSSEVKMVQLHKYKGGYAVTAVGAVEIATNKDNNKDNKDKREANTTKAIRECLRTAGTQTQMAICGVSGPEVAVRYFKFPSLPPEEIEGAVLLEAAQVCPFNVGDDTVDYQLISDGGDNVTGVLVAATNKLIQRKKRLIENASLKCVLMDVEGLALLNCVSELKPNGSKRANESGTIAVLNVGNSHTTLAIMGDNGLPFIRDITCAGNDIVEQIATENGVLTERVREILFGCENPAAKPEVGNSLAGACEKLIVDVTETLRYYTAQEKSTVVEKVFVCGGFALVKGFAELLNSRLSAQAMLWNPFDKVCCDACGSREAILAKKGPAMAVATGLAMRSI
ncbi:MAG: type IV pilus assembly protein PilM [Planctomycetota bacterium]|jgi:type IV pilus assembly protein PilM